MPGICPQCAYETLPQSALEDYFELALMPIRSNVTIVDSLPSIYVPIRNFLCTVRIIYCFISIIYNNYRH